MLDFNFTFKNNTAYKKQIIKFFKVFIKCRNWR